MLIFLSNVPSSFKLCFLRESGKTIWFLPGLRENSIIFKGYFQGISYVFLETQGKFLGNFCGNPVMRCGGNSCKGFRRSESTLKTPFSMIDPKIFNLVVENSVLSSLNVKLLIIVMYVYSKVLLSESKENTNTKLTLNKHNITSQR